MSFSDVYSINVLFQRYLDIYRTKYGFSMTDVQKFYDNQPGLWSFNTKDTSVAYNIILTPDITCLPPNLNRNMITTYKILILVVYFDDITYYQQRNSNKKLYSMYLNPFIDQFHSDLKKCVTNISQRSNLNILRYTLNTKQEYIDLFMEACTVYTSKL